MSFLARHWAHVGSVFPVSHSVADYLKYHDTTLTDIEVQNTDLEFSHFALQPPLWSAKINCESVGNFSYELKISYANGDVQVLEFAVDVTDATNTGQVGGRFGR